MVETEHHIQVPTLHVIFIRPLPPTVVLRTYPYGPSQNTVDGVRNELIAWIADEALAGDREAAEWVLLTSIARVCVRLYIYTFLLLMISFSQSRAPPILPPSLTLSQFPPPPLHASSKAPALSIVLSHLFPLVSTLPLSLDIINRTQFAPESKDEDLHSGWLQLPSGSICLITEGGVSEGTVNDRGWLIFRFYCLCPKFSRAYQV